MGGGGDFISGILGYCNNFLVLVSCILKVLVISYNNDMVY